MPSKNAAAQYHENQNVKRAIRDLELERERVGGRIDTLDQLHQWTTTQTIAHEKLGEQYDDLTQRIKEARALIV